MPISITPNYAKYLLKNYKDALLGLQKKDLSYNDKLVVEDILNKLREIAEYKKERGVSPPSLLLIKDETAIEKIAEKYLREDTTLNKNISEFVGVIKNQKILLRLSKDGDQVKLAVDCPSKEIRDKFVEEMKKALKEGWHSSEPLTNIEVQKWLQVYPEADKSFYIPAEIIHSMFNAIFAHRGIQNLFENLLDLKTKLEINVLDGTLAITKNMMFMAREMVTDPDYMLAKPVDEILKLLQKKEEQKKDKDLDKKDGPASKEPVKSTDKLAPASTPTSLPSELSGKILDEPSYPLKLSIPVSDEKLRLVYTKLKKDQKNEDIETANLERFYHHFMKNPVSDNASDRKLYRFYFTELEAPFARDFFDLVVETLKGTKCPMDVGHGQGKANLNNKFAQPKGGSYAWRFSLLEEQFNILKEKIEERIGLKSEIKASSSGKSSSAWNRITDFFGEKNKGTGHQLPHSTDSMSVSSGSSSSSSGTSMSTSSPPSK